MCNKGRCMQTSQNNQEKELIIFVRSATVILHSTHGSLNCSHWLTQI